MEFIIRMIGDSYCSHTAIDTILDELLDRIVKQEFGDGFGNFGNSVKVWQ